MAEQNSSPAGLVTGLAHVGLRVYDLERSRVFYELLGFEFVAGPIGAEPVAIMRHRSGLEINLILNAARASSPNVLMDEPEKHAGYTHIALEVSNVVALKAALERDGIVITEGPVRFESGFTSVFVRDPDRNVIEFTQPA